MDEDKYTSNKIKSQEISYIEESKHTASHLIMEDGKL